VASKDPPKVRWFGGSWGSQLEQAQADDFDQQRAELVVRCACELLGLQGPPPAGSELLLPLSEEHFGLELVARFGREFPKLVYCPQVEIARARLERPASSALPTVRLHPPDATIPATRDDVAAGRS
jgi:hypothetical protein